MKYAFFIAILAMFVVAVSGAKANGFGVTLDKPVGNYIVNVDYDAIAGIYSGDPVQFAFQLFNKDRSEQLDFRDVWVSITPSGKGAVFAQPVFDGGILGSTFPPSSMTFVFPEAGSYILNLRFEKGDKTLDEKTLAEASFPLEVQAGSQSGGQAGFFRITNDFLKGAASVIFLVMLFVVGRVFLRRKETS